MALMAYCRKCKQEVPPRELCEICGTKLTKTSTRVSWSVQYKPLGDLEAWNVPLRVLIPVIIAIALIIIVIEAVENGVAGLQFVFSQWFFPLIAALLAGMVLGIMLYLVCRGRELQFYVLDQKGIHLQLYARASNRFRHFEKGSLSSEDGWRLTSERHVAWEEIRRIALVKERNAILVYSPKWWLIMTLYANMPELLEAATFIKKRIGRKKTVVLQEIESFLNQQNVT